MDMGAIFRHVYMERPPLSPTQKNPKPTNISALPHHYLDLYCANYCLKKKWFLTIYWYIWIIWMQKFWTRKIKTSRGIFKVIILKNINLIELIKFLHAILGDKQERNIFMAKIRWHISSTKLVKFIPFRIVKFLVLWSVSDSKILKRSKSLTFF